MSAVSMVPKPSNSWVQVHIQQLYPQLNDGIDTLFKWNLLKGFNSAKTQSFSVPVLDDRGIVCFVDCFW
jgi:hypothetical protein